MSKSIMAMALVSALTLVTSVCVDSANAQENAADDVYQEAIWDIQKGSDDYPNAAQYAANTEDDADDDVYQEAIWNIQAGPKADRYATRSASLPMERPEQKGQYMVSQSTPSYVYDEREDTE